MMLNLRSKSPIFTYIASGAVAAALIIFIYAPLARRAALARQEYAHLSEEFAGAKLAVESLRNLREDCQLIKDSGVPSIINAISKKGKELDIDLKSMDQMGTRVVADKYRALSIKMDMEARYDAIGKFITELDALSGCAITIDSFKVQKRESPKMAVKATIVISVYLEPVENT